MDFSWLLVAAILVFFMQAGFLCLETGKIRSKNSINVAAKNISDFIVAAISYWLFGFALMFGHSVGGFFGADEFLFGEHNTPFQISFFLFQLMFCGTAATLLSGAVAERMSFMGYICVAAVLSAVVYPIAGHWSWASVYTPENLGWLEALGFVDFAGSTVVHSVGGWVALAAVLIIGPRLGRFGAKRKMSDGSNLPMSALGALLIWVGWFGFNGGSTLVLNHQVPGIILNTCIAAVFSGLIASSCHFLQRRFIDVGFILNGIIAGLVAITAACHAVTPAQAMLIGGVAGIVVYLGTGGIERLKIDDALGVIPAHLFAGIWGTLAVALYGDLTLLDTGLSRAEQLVAQCIGIGATGIYSFGVSYLALKVINYVLPLRVSAEQELQGMNISEHRASTELLDLLTSMDRQQAEGSFSEPVPVEPFTEVGQIAKQYNRVINRVNEEISRRDDAIQNFRSSEKRKSAILDSSMDSILTIDLQGNIIEFNPASERTFGYLKRHVTGKNFIDLFVPEHWQKAVRESLNHKFMTSEGLLRNRRNALPLRRSSNDEFPAEITITGANLGNTANREFTLHIRDVTRQLKLHDKLKQLAYSDPLTGLYNRSYLMDALVQAIERSQHEQSSVVIFFMDLDRFKKINDTLGHKAGDSLLCEVANRLIRVTRGDDIIARWGGDEFVIMICGNFSEQLACQRALRILEIMREPLELEGRTLNIPTSVGIAMATHGEVSAEQLIQHADLAMYAAKQAGRDNYCFFEPQMAKTAARNFDYEQEMKRGLKDGHFYLVYQPKVTANGTLVGLEALLRWLHPKEGAISPKEFIPLAEESDLVIALGEKVIDDVLRQLSQWKMDGLKLLPVAVNISGRHMVSGRLETYVEQKLADYALKGNLLEIEITEGVLLTDMDRCLKVMDALKKMQVKMSVDDFGTGYSSLNYLKRLPLDVLKIDRSFVDECATTAEDGQICSTIISLANNLELTTVAEGVETKAQLDFLKARGCEIFQGFYFHKPAAASSIEKLLVPDLEEQVV